MTVSDTEFYHNRHVWIIGASSGIGQALALELASRRAKVTVSARRLEKLEQLQYAHDNINALRLDVSEQDSIEQAIDMFEKSNDMPDTLVYASAFYEPRSIHQMTADELSTTIKTNLWAAMEICRLIMPIFYRRQSGQIALVASVAGYRGLPKGQPYSATKAGLINFAETLYIEAKAKSVDVKLVSPGFVETPMTDKNDFKMQDVISSEQAAGFIADGLTTDRFEIHFPKRFTRKLKFLRMLPHKLFFKLAEKL